VAFETRYQDLLPDAKTGSALLEQARADVGEMTKEYRNTVRRAYASLKIIENPKPLSPPPLAYYTAKERIAGQMAEAELFKHRLMSAKEGLDKLEDESRRAPHVRAESTRLERDYEEVKNNYDALLARRDAVRAAEKCQ
jgi:uncharacterized protein involved in exopolysaccharide biosynthesis